MGVKGGGKLTDKHLPDATAQREPQHIPPHSGMPRQEAQRGLELPAATPRHIHAEPLAQPRMHQPRAQQQVPARDHRPQQVVGRHHLRPRVRLEVAKDVVLRRVGQAVKEQVDAEQQHAPGGLARVAGGLVLAAARVQREDGDAAGHGGDDQVLVERVALAEHGDVQEHDGEQLAALGEDVSDVVDVGEGGVAEGGGEGVGEGDEEERAQDLAVGDQGRGGLAARGGEDGEELAAEEGEEGLDGEEEDGELEALRGGGGAVGGGGELFLEVGPCQAGEEGGIVRGLGRQFARV